MRRQSDVYAGDHMLLICASPRRGGTSAMLLARLQQAVGGEVVFLYDAAHLADVVAAMQQANTIVVSGPCYINAYPALLCELLERAGEVGAWRGQKLYGVINGGMPYIHTHKPGVESLRLFAEKNGLAWMGSFVLGGGAMLDGRPLEKHLSARRIVPAFHAFVRHVADGTSVPDRLAEDAQKKPGRLIAHLISKLLNRSVDRRLRAFGHDPYGPPAACPARPEEQGDVRDRL